jgi:hypothetical protein
MGAPGQYRHLQSVRRRRATGETYFTHYHRKARVRLAGEPGTPEFDAAYRDADEGRAVRQGKPCWVYFVQAERSLLIKIGKADRPRHRLIELQCGSAETLNLLGVIHDESGGDLERDLHRLFAPLRSRREWFEPGDALLAYIAWRAQPAAPEQSAPVVTAERRLGL